MAEEEAADRKAVNTAHQRVIDGAAGALVQHGLAVEDCSGAAHAAGLPAGHALALQAQSAHCCGCSLLPWKLCKGKPVLG
jgi:hypothetical protein